MRHHDTSYIFTADLTDIQRPQRPWSDVTIHVKGRTYKSWAIQRASFLLGCSHSSVLYSRQISITTRVVFGTTAFEKFAGHHVVERVKKPGDRLSTRRSQFLHRRFINKSQKSNKRRKRTTNVTRTRTESPRRCRRAFCKY